MSSSTILILAVIVLLLLVAGAMVLWLMRQERRLPIARSTFSPSRTGQTRPAPLSASSAGERPRAANNKEDDSGPETVLSYLDVPANSEFHSDYMPSMPAPLTPSKDDFGPSTLPPPLTAAQLARLQGIDPAGLNRIEHALQALAADDSPLDQAWETLRGFRPEPGHREACLETLERIAMGYEREHRYDCARDVYEHMADIDPNWRHVKLRLMRARGLAQAATANTWGTLPSRPMPEVSKKQLGKYVVERQIGRGAMGAVYLGYHPATDHKVALKTMSLAQEFHGDELADARARFLREAEMAGRLAHPDIVSIIDAGELDGLAFIAMELVEGTDLSHFAQPDKLLPLNELLMIAGRVAEALAYAHSRGVTHRDIKPANIMVDRAQGAVKVMDFGVARVADATRTRTGVVLGTPTFMSPEQLSGQTIDGRSDLYSLGVTLFQLLTGQLPYRNDSMAALMRAIARETAPNVCSLRPELPTALGDIVALALEKHPNTRYANGQQMAEDLRAVMSALSGLDIPLG